MAPSAEEPDEALLAIYLRKATPTANERRTRKGEAERVAAVANLRLLLKRQTEAGLTDPRLQEFFASASARILLETDPVASMKEFIHGRPQRGRKESDPDRNLEIAVAVERLRRESNTLDRSYEIVGRQRGLSPEAVETIYRNRSEGEVCAAIALAEIERGASSDPAEQ